MTSLGGSSYFASDGAAYELFLGRWTRRLALPFIDFAHFAAEGALLDIGTGTGSLALAMAARWPGRRVVGIDIAEPYIAYARAQRDRAIPTFVIGDACKLPYENGSFAGATAQLVLNFTADPAAALAEMRRVTAFGGTVTAAVWDFRGGLVFQRMFWDTAAGIDPQAGVARDRLFSAALALPDGLPKLFEQVGFAQIERASITIRMDYADFNDYWQPLPGGQGPVGSYVAGLPDEMRARIEQAVRRAYCSGSTDGERSLTATAWAVRGIVP